MLCGRRQAVDGVYVKANASMDSMIEPEILLDAATYGKELDENQDEPKTPAVEIRKDCEKDDDGLRAKKNPTNKTHYSPSDPDAKMSVKPGKPVALNYLGQVSVDTGSHVITHIQAFEADQRDSECLPEVIERVVESLRENDLIVEELIADAGYSSGTALKALEENNITGFIPNKTQFVYERPGFTYHSEGDYYSCPVNQKLTYKGTFEAQKGVYNKEYKANRRECNKCSLKANCSVYGKYATIIRETVDKPYYQRMHIRMQSKQARVLMKRRQATVEPVIGTLINYLGMKR